MILKSIYKFAYIPFLMFLSSSCFVAKTYQQPEVSKEAYFRTDNLASDSTSMAEMSWKELFTDSVLIQHLETGLENNLDVRVALAQIAIAESYFKQGKVGQLPTFSMSGQVNHQELSANSQFGSFFDGGITQYDVTGTMAWEADIWGKIRSTRRAFEASYLQTTAAHQAIKSQLVGSMASLYFQLIALDEQMKVTNATIAIRKNALETTKALKQAGIVSEVGVKQTEAQVYTAEALRIDLQLQMKLVENTFSILLGEGPQEINRGNFAQQLLPEELKTGFPMQLLSNRPDVKAAELGLINAFELTNVAKSAFYPSLRINASSGLQSLELDQLFSLNSVFANVVGGITQPIFNGRRIRTAYEVSLSQQEIAYLNFRQSILNANKEVSDAIYGFQAAEDKIKIKAAEFEAYDLAITYSEELLENGLANYLEVLNARENALNTEISLINARFTKYKSIVDLYKSLGGGWQ